MSSVFVGIDPSSESFTASVFRSPDDLKSTTRSFSNSIEGITTFEEWLQTQDISRDEMTVCIENTGVYSETLSYTLHEKGYRICLLDPRSVSKAFGDGRPKSDPLDSRKIAEYGFRYADKLKVWQPHQVIVEQVRVILSTREQLVQQKTATQNSRSSLARKFIQTPAANRALEETVSYLNAQIAELENELKRLIRSHPTLMQGVSLLMTAPGVSWLLSAHLLVITRGFETLPRYTKLAQYLGISPNERQSGTSLNAPARSRRYGPPIARKLLHLAARSLRTHDEQTRRYFHEKVAQGKPKRLVMNNIANKLVRKLCAMLHSQTPYIDGHRSLNPRLFPLRGSYASG